MNHPHPGLKLHRWEHPTNTAPSSKLRMVLSTDAPNSVFCDPVAGAFDRVMELCKSTPPKNALADLLRAAARELDAWVYFVGADGRCRGPVGGGRRVDHTMHGPPRAGDVGSALGSFIDSAQASNRCVCPRLSGESRAVLGGMIALLGKIPTLDADRTGNAGVLIAIRESARRFDDSDRIAADVLLLGGAQMLRAAELVEQHKRSTIEAVWTLANVIDARDNHTAGHSQRVAWLAKLTGEALGLDDDALQTLEWAGALHDVGKLGVAERILNKPGPLTDVEREQIRQHPRLGCEVLRPMTGLQGVLDAVLHHHENHDGSGYPDGLAGNAIPLFARILHVVDIFDALISDRPYRAGLPFRDALAELQRGAGTITDPQVTAVFLATVKEVRTLDPEVFDRRCSAAGV